MVTTHKCNKEVEITTISTNLTNMQEDISEMKEMMKEGFKEFRDQFKSNNERITVTEGAVRTNKEEIDKIKDDRNWAIKIVIGAIILALLGLILI